VAEVFLRRTLSGFSPADEASAELCRSFKINETYRADIVRPRNGPWHRRYWKLVSVVYENCEQFASAELLHGYLKLRCGVSTPVASLATGEVFMVPGSIAFHRMTQEQFEAFWTKVVEVVTTEIIPGLNAKDLSQEIEKLCGLAG